MLLRMLSLLFGCWFGMVSLGTLSLARADELTEKQRTLFQLYQDLKEQRQKVKQAKKKEETALTRLFRIRAELKRTRGELVNAQQRLSFNESRLGRVQGQLQEAEFAYQVQMRRFLTRLAEFYKSGRTSYLELVLGSHDMSEFSNRAYYFGKIIDYDAALTDALQKQRSFIERKRTEVAGLTEQVRGLTRLISDQEKVVAQKAVEKHSVYLSLRKEREVYERQLAEKRAASGQLEGIIRNILARSGGKVDAKVSGKFIWPISGSLSSHFGYRRHPLWGGSDFHTGIDIVSPYGRPIRAADGGQVIFSGWWDGYGKAVVIDHGKGKSTVYAHMSRIFLNNGQKAGKGETVGLVGSTGYSTGSHLHFEVRVNGKPKNPLAYLP